MTVARDNRREDLDTWLMPFFAYLTHPAQRGMCPTHIAGLIDPCDRKSIQRLAGRTNDAGACIPGWHAHLEVPKLRTGACFPGFLEPGKTVEKALVSVIKEARIVGVSTRRVDEQVQAIGRASATARRGGRSGSISPRR